MKELKPRDRIIRTLRHEKVDRVPVFYRMKHEAKEKLARVCDQFGYERLLDDNPRARKLRCGTLRETDWGAGRIDGCAYDC